MCEKYHRKVTSAPDNFFCKREKIKNYVYLARERTAKRVRICPLNEEKKKLVFFLEHDRQKKSCTEGVYGKV